MGLRRKYLQMLVDNNDVAGLKDFGYNKVYHVNNITGSSSATGLSWDQAMDEVNTAITASEVARLASWGSGTTNNNHRNLILVQGTETTYDSLTAFPSFCDVIGVGADPRGDGTGIVVIGTGAANNGAGAQRGNYWENIQFKVDTDEYSAFYGSSCLRTTFKNCAFMSRTAASTAVCGVKMTAACGGVTFLDCHFGTNGAGQLTYGIYITAGFNNCRVENCHITAVTAGIYLTGSNCTNTIIKNNTIGGGTSTQVVTGIAAGGHELIMGNFVTASSDAISGATAVNTVDNQVINNATAARELA